MLHKVLLISGFDRSGKSTVSRVLEAHGFYIFECGSVVRNLVDSDDKIQVSTFYEKNMQHLDTYILDEILKSYLFNKKLAIIGVRSSGLFSLLKENFPAIKVVFVDSNNEMRYQRYLQNSARKNLSFNLFLKNDSMQIKWGLNTIKGLADIVIKNNNDYQDFLEKIQEMVKSI